ncbi:MAG TPA: hypothetical protein VMG62_05295 [Solirubrobacteraceae bacterium]|nr:hypothetical protein [Solirubrobacteraceae bacterium]
MSVPHSRPAGGSVAVSMPPVGLSIEYSVLAEYLGSGACPPQGLVEVLQRLGSPPLALAGDSQDMTAPSGALSEAPASWEAATLYPLPAAFWSQLHCLLSATHDPLAAGVNAERGALGWAQQIVAGAQSAATNGLEVSIGNEPDLYDLPDYASLASRPVGEDVAAVNLYLQIASHLRQSIAGAALIGPELAVASRWRGQLPRVISQLGLRTVGVHEYPLSACASSRAVTLHGLLSAYAANAVRKLAWVVADANAARVPAILSEVNSASCGGVAGVSDRPAAGVWAVRFVLSALKTGFREVRFHLSGGAYDPFVMRAGAVLERPLESALVALNRWLPVGATVQSLAGVHGLVATSVSSPGSVAELILDNETPHRQVAKLVGSLPVKVEALAPAHAGIRGGTLTPRHGRLRLRVAPNTVLVLGA